MVVDVRVLLVEGSVTEPPPQQGHGAISRSVSHAVPALTTVTAVTAIIIPNSSTNDAAAAAAAAACGSSTVAIAMSDLPVSQFRNLKAVIVPSQQEGRARRRSPTTAVVVVMTMIMVLMLTLMVMVMMMMMSASPPRRCRAWSHWTYPIVTVDATTTAAAAAAFTAVMMMSAGTVRRGCRWW